jgi:hypothetical protein
MLEIQPMMNSAVQDIFDFKTCCQVRIWDLNLEIHVRNVGKHAVVIPSYFDLDGKGGKRRIQTLMPHGEHRIEPGQLMAFYCFMDEEVWRHSQRMVFYDRAGNVYELPIRQKGR